MAQQYYGLLTNVGLAKLAAAASGGPALALASMAFGDGGGLETAPTKAATALVNERYRAPVVDKYPHPTNPSIIYVEGIIPSGIGGWTMREAGIYDAAGDLIVIAKPPAMNVALIAEGASTEGIVRLPIVFDNLDAVTMMVDPTVTLATQGWVLDRLLSRPFLTVNSVSTVATPANPAAHAVYVVPVGATGAWAAQVGKLAYYLGGWIYRDAPVSLVVGASDTSKYWQRTAGGWAEFTASPTVPGLVQFATAAEVLAAALDSKAISPKTVAPAVQSGKWNYAVAAGTANALTVTLDPAPAALADLTGALIRVKVTTTNTGAATLKIGALAATAITRADATPLKAGDLFAGAITDLIYDGTRFQLAGVLTSALPTESVVSYTTAGTYTFVVPAGVTRLKRLRLWGGGGSGGGTDASVSSAGAGGGGGGYVETANVPVTPGSSITIIVGAGGAAVNGGPGLAGGASSVAVTPALTAAGGGAGPAMGGGIASPGGVGGAASGGNVLNMTGGAGGTGVTIAGGVLSGAGGAGFGTSQSGPNAQSDGAAGIRFGGGGAGGSSNGTPRAGGAGAAGAVIIEY